MLVEHKWIYVYKGWTKDTELHLEKGKFGYFLLTDSIITSPVFLGSYNELLML